MSSGFYAVKIGRNPGIYLTWDACKQQVHQYPGAKYKKFHTKGDANQYFGYEGEIFPPATEKSKHETS